MLGGGEVGLGTRREMPERRMGVFVNVDQHTYERETLKVGVRMECLGSVNGSVNGSVKTVSI